MPKTAQTCVLSSVGDQRKLTRNTLVVEAHLERVDQFPGTDYVPMDVFVNPETCKEHFHYSPTRAGTLGIAEATNR